MKAYRTYITVTDPKKIVLNDVPFERGERVEALLLAREESDPGTVQELDSLLKASQGLPQIQTLSDDDIAAEVAAYRSGRCEK